MLCPVTEEEDLPVGKWRCPRMLQLRCPEILVTNFLRKVGQESKKVFVSFHAGIKSTGQSLSFCFCPSLSFLCELNAETVEISGPWACPDRVIVHPSFEEPLSTATICHFRQVFLNLPPISSTTSHSS